MIAGATAPEGDLQGPARRVSPLKFLRELLCLRDRKELQRGRLPEPGPLRRALPPPDHARAPAATARPRSATTPGSSRWARSTASSAPPRRRTPSIRPGLRRDVWATEFWWETNPPTPTGFYEAPSERRQARNIADALRLLWKERVEVALLFQVRDSADVTGPPRKGWATGHPLRRRHAARTPTGPCGCRSSPTGSSRDRVSTWTRVPARASSSWSPSTTGDSGTLARIDVAAGDVVTRARQAAGRGRAWSPRIAGERSNAWPVKAKAECLASRIRAGRRRRGGSGVSPSSGRRGA